MFCCRLATVTEKQKEARTAVQLARLRKDCLGCLWRDEKDKWSVRGNLAQRVQAGGIDVGVGVGAVFAAGDGGCLHG